MRGVAAFVTARLDEWEAELRERPAGALIHISGCYYYNHTLDAGWYCDCDTEVDDPSGQPLRQVAAMRRIVERCQASSGYMGAEIEEFLATIWADHPDYPLT